MKSKVQYTIGTRGSLLALAQCQQVRRQLEHATGDDFTLKIFKTEGDQQQQHPLWQMPGQDFFTKELDRALLEGEVDLTVHSCKDLSTQRPEGIHLAAITQRHYGEDILLARREVLHAGALSGEFIVGTSAPRRMANLKRHLADFLPFGGEFKIDIRPLRGNVDTRLDKLKRGDYHAIVLALAGLERLACAEENLRKMANSLQGLNFMLLPCSHFPPAAGQGALAIECLRERPDRGELLAKLASMDHSSTRREVECERRDFAAYGGGCHLAVGVCARTVNGHLYTVHRGESEGRTVDKQTFQRQRRSFTGKRIFLGLPERSLGHIHGQNIPEVRDALIRKIPHGVELPRTPHHILVASRHGVSSLQQSVLPSGHYLWASGPETMKGLAQMGLWVRGCLDGLGEEGWPRYLHSQALQLMIEGSPAPLVLTHPDARSEVGQVLGSYHREVRKEEGQGGEYARQLQQCDAFYWSSFPQYQTFCQNFPFIKDKWHACGPGKTYRAFQRQDIEVELFAGVRDFREWAGAGG